MKLKRKLAVLTLAICGALTGCQTPEKNNAPSAEKQVSQLAAAVSGADWLRDHCARTDIADGEMVKGQALQQAIKRGWEIQHPLYQQLDEQIARRYQAINEDSLEKSEKCAHLNRALSEFLQRSQSIAEYQGRK